MTTTADHRTQLETIEADVLDEVAIAAAAQDFSRRLVSLTSRRQVALRDAQVLFDTKGLPRGLRTIL